MHYADPVKVEVVNDIRDIELVIPLPDNVPGKSQSGKKPLKQ
jgi:hypothetical protein